MSEQLKQFRKENSEPVSKALKAAIDAGEPWAITLGAYYCMGKPTEHKFHISELSNEELRIEIERRRRDELGRVLNGSGQPALPEATEPH